MSFRARLLLALATLALIIGAIGASVLLSGVVSVAATRPHYPVIDWILQIGMHRSVSHHARMIDEPPLDDPALVRRGMRLFETDCVPCHGAPGVARADAGDAMLPPGPELSQTSREWRARELFWIVKHGIKMTGMPAWGPTHRDDEIWAAVAFMRALEGATPEDWRRMTQVPAAAREAEAIGTGRLVALAGPAVQNSAACGRCHGLDGTADPSGAFPRLDGQRRDYLRETLRAYASGARRSGIMTSLVRGLTEAERDAVAAYYAELPRVPLPAAEPPKAELLAAGKALAETGAPRQAVPPCLECHGASPAPNRPRAPVIEGQYAPYLALQLRLWKSGARGADGRASIMREIAQRLDEAQIEAAAAYFAAQPPPR